LNPPDRVLETEIWVQVPPLIFAKPGCGNPGIVKLPCDVTMRLTVVVRVRLAVTVVPVVTAFTVPVIVIG